MKKNIAILIIMLYTLFGVMAIDRAVIKDSSPIVEDIQKKKRK